MRTPVDLVGGFYTDDSLPWSCQDTVNYIPVAAESGGTRTVSKLVDAPGLRPWQWIGNFENGVESAPIRGLHDVEGQLFVVCGRTLYQISNAGVAIPRGTIPGVGRVSMAHNQRSNGNELIVVNGSGGYVWNTGTQTFSIITDTGYPGASVVDFIDGYLMQVEPFGRFLFHSDLADALEYNTLDRFEAETAPDRTLGMIVNHQEVWAFGERTIDVFGNAGTAQGTFQNKGVSISRGCAAKWTPAVIDNGVAWLGDDLKVYHAVGYSPVRISTRAIEVALSECSQTDLRNAFSFVWEDLSHAVYYLTIPNGPTFGYDFSTRLWHRRASWHPERDISGRWRINDLVRHNGQWIGGDYQNGKLYVLDWDYMMEGSDPLVRERVSPAAHANGYRFTADSLELHFATGGPPTKADDYPWPVQPTGPSISGAAPDGTVGYPYGPYSYTVTAGDAAIVRVEVVSGQLPPGLSLTNAGEIEAGAPSGHGDFTFTVRVTDANGLTAELVDTVTISNVGFLLFRSNREGLWASPSLDSWGSMYSFTPTTVNLMNGDVVAEGGRFVASAIMADSGMVEHLLFGPLPPYTGGTVNITSAEQPQSGLSLLPSNMFASGGVIVAWERNANLTHYWVSTDSGSTWGQVPAPGGHRVRGVARMSSGRWIAHSSQGSSGGVYYSDQEVPMAWTLALSQPNYSSTYCVAAGDYGYYKRNTNAVYRSADGGSWSIVNDGVHTFPASSKLFVTSTGRVIAYGNSSFVSVSDDRGVTFAQKTTGNSIDRVKEVAGVLYASTKVAAILSSHDDGDTWQQHSVPWTGLDSAYILPYEVMP